VSTAKGRSRPTRLDGLADTKKLRRYFIGGSDARIIMGNVKLRRSGAKSSRRICRAISWCKWAWPPRTSIGAGIRPIPDG
jgi:hypothetical protein